MTTTQARTTWVGYGRTGAVGSIRQDGLGYEVWVAGADASLGRYPELEIAKRALRSHARQGAGDVTFQRR